MKIRDLPVSEEAIQRAVLEYLAVKGYIALQTSHRTKKVTCGRCQSSFYPQGGYGASKGVPDIIVTSRKWPARVWAGFEIKGPKTRLSPEQKSLLDDGRIFVVRSIEDAQAALDAIEGRTK